MKPRRVRPGLLLALSSPGSYLLAKPSPAIASSCSRSSWARSANRCSLTISASLSNTIPSSSFQQQPMSFSAEGSSFVSLSLPAFYPKHWFIVTVQAVASTEYDLSLICLLPRWGAVSSLISFWSKPLNCAFSGSKRASGAEGAPFLALAEISASCAFSFCRLSRLSPMDSTTLGQRLCKITMQMGRRRLRGSLRGMIFSSSCISLAISWPLRIDFFCVFFKLSLVISRPQVVPLLPPS